MVDRPVKVSSREADERIGGFANKWTGFVFLWNVNFSRADRVCTYITARAGEPS